MKHRVWFLVGQWFFKPSSLDNKEKNDKNEGVGK